MRIHCTILGFLIDSEQGEIIPKQNITSTPTNVDPSMFLQGEDYDLKERINGYGG
jgi:hypothetical protein